MREVVSAIAFTTSLLYRKHHFMDIMTIAILSVISGADR